MPTMPIPQPLIDYYSKKGLVAIMLGGPPPKNFVGRVEDINEIFNGFLSVE